MEENTSGSQKTAVAFIVGLVIGGLLVWVFTAPHEKSAVKDEKKEDTKAVTAEEKKDEFNFYMFIIFFKCPIDSSYYKGNWNFRNNSL